MVSPVTEKGGQVPAARLVQWTDAVSPRLQRSHRINRLLPSPT
jgi:hypothetical protein